MNYIELRITASEAEQDLLIAELDALGASGFEQTGDVLLAFFDEGQFAVQEVHEVLKKFAVQQNTITEKNWNAEWEASFQPVLVPGFCAVRAHFHEPITAVPHQIVITPKMSFGTGHHATTFLMLQSMQALDFTSKTVLDFGTGTGVLAILAEQLGANAVTAIDNDAWSFENVQENIALNQCKTIIPVLADKIPAASTYDVILANITRNVLLEHMRILKSCLADGGRLLLSGFFKDDIAEMEAAARTAGFKLLQQAQKNGWAALLFAN